MPERRLLFAIILSMVVVFAWQILFPVPVPKPRSVAVHTDSGLVASGRDTPALNSRDSDGLPAENGLDSRLIDLDSELVHTPMREPRRVEIDRPLYRVLLDEKGGVLRNLDLTRYVSHHPKGAPSPVNMVHGETAPIGHLALAMEPTDRSGLAGAFWEISEDSRSVLMKIAPHTSELPPGIVLEKKLTLEDSYAADLVITIRNLSNRRVPLSSARFEYPLQGTSREGSLLLHIGPGVGANNPAHAYLDQYKTTGSFSRAGKRQDAVMEKSWSQNIFGVPDESTNIEWAALENRYFAIAARPEGFTADALFQRDSASELNLWLLLPSCDIEAGAVRNFHIRIFAGPKSTSILHNFSADLQKLDGMEPSILPKRISIARMMVAMLEWIEGFVHNWGWGIILLTVAVRALLFPLAAYQFKSMARMQGLKPRIDELQLRYATDKERLQRELMGVYKEAGVNPLSGCLPILIQMPIMVGLFIALQSAIELRGVPFLSWISDLSIPDTITVIMGIPINPLPLVMGGTMWMQQKLTPMPSADPAQQQVMMMMPIMMTVLFYNFPSGLSLYWCTQNILSIAQQYYILKKREVAKV